MGCMFRIAGRHKAAISLFKTAQQSGLDTPKLHYNLASSLKEVDELEDSLFHFLRAVELDNEGGEVGLSAKQNVAALYILLGRPADAVTVCEEILLQSPHEAVAWWNLNTSLRHLGRVNEAIDRSWKIYEELSQHSRPQMIYNNITSATSVPSAPLVVSCVKWGTKYNAASVNRLFIGCKNHLHVPHVFVCLTDDAHGLNESILILPLPESTLMKVCLFTFLFIT